MNSTTNSLDTSASAAAQADQVACIRLYGSGANPIILDSIPGSAIEPLTLETFGALAQRHHAIGKNLIIARVDVAFNDANLEPDELPETRSFYYHAHSLNKILFRTFGQNGEYLFRLFALNPMTNTDMVGDVVYFMIYPGTPVHRLRPRSLSNPGRNSIIQGTAISQQTGGASSDLVFALAGSPTAALQSSGPTLRTIATPSGILELCENDFSALETMMSTGHASNPTPPAVRSPNRSRGASADGATSVRSATNLRSFEHLMEQSIGKSNQIRIAEVVGPRLNAAVLLSDHQQDSANVGEGSSAGQSLASSSPQPHSAGPPRGQRSRSSSVGAGVASRPQPSASAFRDRRTSTGQPEFQATAPSVLRPTRSYGDSEPAPTDAPTVAKAASCRRSSRTPRAGPDLNNSTGTQKPGAESIDNHVDTPPELGSAGMTRSPSAASDGSPARSKDFAARLRERLESHTSSIALHQSANGVSRPSASLVLLANRSPTSMPTSQQTQPSQNLYHSPIPLPDAPNSLSNSNWKITLRPKTRASTSSAGGSNSIYQSSSRHLAAPGVVASQSATVSHQPATLEASRFLAVAAGQPASTLPEPGSLLSMISSGDCSAKVSADSCGNTEEKSAVHLYRTTSPEPVTPPLSPLPHPSKSVATPETQPEHEDLGCSALTGCASSLSKSAPARTSGPHIRIGVNVSLSRNSQRSSTSMSSQSTGPTTTAPLILHAMFIGTDDDFLIMPHLRAAFAQNALTPEDMTLFEISREMLLDEGIVLPELLDELGVSVPGMGADLIDEDVNALGELSLADDSPGLNPYLPPDLILGADGEIINPPGVDDWTNFMMDPSAVDSSAHTPPSNSAYASATTMLSPNRRGSRTGGSITLTYNGMRRQSATSSNPFNIPAPTTGGGGGGGRRRSSLQPLHMTAAHQAIAEDRYSDTVWRRLRLWTTVMGRTESWESNEELPLEQHHRIRHAVTNLSQGGTKYLVVTCVAVAALLMVGLFWSAGMSHDIQLLLIVSICVFYFGGMASLCVVDYRSIKHRRHMRHHQVGPQPGFSRGNGGGPASRAGNSPVNRRVNTVVS